MDKNNQLIKYVLVGTIVLILSVAVIINLHWRTNPENLFIPDQSTFPSPNPWQ